MSRILAVLLLFALSPLHSNELQADGTRMLRYPDISGDRVVFSYAGDLWLAPLDDSEPARRLTSHPGLELYPKFSPDGKQIAFTGQYRGDEQVYVIDTDGGAPRQLTYYPTQGPLPARWGTEHQVYAWSPDGKNVLFRSHRYSALDPRLFRVSVDGGLPQALPMLRAGSGDYSPDGKSVFYSPLFRDFRTWKRYQGGWAQNLYVFDLEHNTARQLTDNIRTERDPVWLQAGMFFVSDRDGTLNLYALADDGAWRAVTHEETWDIKWASGDGISRIVYEVQGQIGLYDAASDSSRLLTVHVPDDQVRRMARRIEVKSQVEGFGVSPGGERLLVTARGDVFSVPVEHGITRNLTQRGDAHDREGAWSPDGKRVAFISDRSGEEQLYVVDQQGGDAKQLGEIPPSRLYRPTWAPDSSAIAVHDQTGKVYVTDLNGRMSEVYHSKYGTVDDYAWAPDSQWLAFTVRTDAGTAAIRIWPRQGGPLIEATDGRHNAYGPAFGADGKHMYFLSDREFAPQIGHFEWNYVANRVTGIFALALNGDSGNPFGPRNDEAGDSAKEDEAGDEKDKSSKDGKPEDVKVVIEADGLADRLIRVPVDADNISGIAPQKTRLLYVTGDAFYYGRDPQRKTTLHAFDFEKRESSDIAEDILDAAPTRDGKYVIVQNKDGFERVEIEKPKEPAKISLDNLVVQRAPAEEWAAIFDEVWRRFRDYFYVRNMHGYDWQALHDRYRPLVDDVSTREDLNTLIGEMIAELNVGHAYIAGGDLQAGPRSTVALLGARFEADARSGRYRISHLYAGNNAEPKYRSPLTEVGAGVSVGDYVLSIDGQPLTTKQNPYQLLTDRGKQPVELMVNNKPLVEGARRVLADPIASESGLDYLEWVQHNYDYVSQQTGGRVGYLHIPDMGEAGIYEFIKWFYPQLRKQGLVVDVRSNGGGNVSQMILRRLMQKPLGFDYEAHSEWVFTYPYTAFNGPMVALISENSASDGDIFPYFFREAGLGPLIGKRTWGGVVGIQDHGPLLDGGQVYVPEAPSGSADGRWIIEGEGVAPDIEVTNDPASDQDAQLDRGIREVLNRIEANPPKFPAKPPEPDKTQ